MPILPTFTASRLQVATYLLLVAPFSIAFLVFLNASVSFLLVERVGRSTGVGDAAGSLSFADELVALAACPLWGAASDRAGVRAVATAGFVIVGLGLWAHVWATDVYPGLLVARMLFAVGGAAVATMVTAILPAMTRPRADAPALEPPSRPDSGGGGGNNRHSIATSVSSELTITPALFRSRSEVSSSARHAPGRATDTDASTSRLAGFVGMFAGVGALISLFFFLTLPTRFEAYSLSPADALAASYYTVSVIAFLVAAGCLFGLRGLPGEEGKSLRKFLRQQSEKERRERYEVLTTSESAPSSPPASSPRATLSTPRALLAALNLARHRPSLALAYLGGFVARASSVGISLFIPLYVHAYMVRRGICAPPESHLPEAPGRDMQRTCDEAYRLASMLTGFSQLVALLCAPVFGYLGGRRALTPSSPPTTTPTTPHGPRTGPHHVRSRSGRNHIIRNHSNTHIPTAGANSSATASPLHSRKPEPLPSSRAASTQWHHWPLLLAAALGFAGHALFATRPRPEIRGAHGDVATVIAVVLMGAGQIGAIVCSLGLLGRGIRAERGGEGSESRRGGGGGGTAAANGDVSRQGPPAASPPASNGSLRPPPSSESTPLISPPSSSATSPPSADMTHVSSSGGGGSEGDDAFDLKGAVAGIYGLFGGAAILILTKLGGLLFDRASTRAPFWLMAGANAALLLVGAGVGAVGGWGGGRRRGENRDGAVEDGRRDDGGSGGLRDG